MLDTTAINFGISKLKDAAAALKPVINTASEQYVRFIAYKVWVKESLFLIFFCMGLGIFHWGKTLKGNMKFDNEYQGFEVQFITGLIVMFIFGLCFLCNIYDLILSLIDPKMYVIDQFLNK
jgi:hypothetical protein